MGWEWDGFGEEPAGPDGMRKGRPTGATLQGHDGINFEDDGETVEFGGSIALCSVVCIQSPSRHPLSYPDITQFPK